ncbi:hypothetical protein GCM10022226_68060 [Sphaerisporangium flaviroseum]|uniref:Uncharacterized protein n=1 Tax=Sphaerisporangium flaviroseum TaxID=509199 RepID=A0ABP7J6X6_9ACTN
MRDPAAISERDPAAISDRSVRDPAVTSVRDPAVTSVRDPAVTSDSVRARPGRQVRLIRRTQPPGPVRGRLLTCDPRHRSIT